MIGNVRKRLPVAAKIALVTAGAMAEVMRRAFGQPPQMDPAQRARGSRGVNLRPWAEQGFADLKLQRRGSISTL
jgi:hypothetical protein